MALLRTFGWSHTNLSLRCPLGCVLAGTKPPQYLLYLSLLLFALTCGYHHHVTKLRMLLLLQSCRTRGPDKSCSVVCRHTACSFPAPAAWHPCTPGELLQPTPGAGIRHPDRWLQLQAAKRPRFSFLMTWGC